ncbi:MAG: hypothetical protein ABF289_04970, partial [Clostridiales bacterium]
NSIIKNSKKNKNIEFNINSGNILDRTEKSLIYNWQIKKSSISISSNIVFIVSQDNSQDKKNFTKTISTLVDQFSITKIIFESDYEMKTSYQSYKKFDKYDLYSMIDKNQLEPIEYITLNYSDIDINLIKTFSNPTNNDFSCVIYYLSKIGESLLDFEDPTIMNKYIDLNKNYVYFEKIYKSSPSNSTNQKNFQNSKNKLLNFYINSDLWVKQNFNFFYNNPNNQNTFDTYLSNLNEIKSKKSSLNISIDKVVESQYEECISYYLKQKGLTDDIFKEVQNSFLYSSILLLNIDHLRLSDTLDLLNKFEISYIVLEET